MAVKEANQRQLNVTLHVNDTLAIKRFCAINGITIAGLFRHVVPRILSENIPLHLTEIRLADAEFKAKGSRF